MFIDRLLDLPAIAFAIVIVFGSLGLITLAALGEWIVITTLA